MIQSQYKLSEEQWRQIENPFPIYKAGRLAKRDNRTLFNAILRIAKSGSTWRDLPEARYGSLKTVYTRFCNCRDRGLLVSIFQKLNEEADFENLTIDSTSVRAHQHFAWVKKT